MSFPSTIDGAFPKTPNAVEERLFELHGVKIKVLLARNDADQYKLTVFDTRGEVPIEKHSTGRFVAKEVCEYSWQIMLRDFSNIFK